MINVVARGGIEPPTQGFSDPCSTILIIYKQPLTEFAFPNPTANYTSLYRHLHFNHV